MAEILTIMRHQNVDTRVVFPMFNHETGALQSGAAGLDSEFALDGVHGAAAPSFADCGHEATEIGSTGIYFLDVAAAEVNSATGSTIHVKTSTEHVDAVVIRIDTTIHETLDAIVALAGTGAIAWTYRVLLDSNGDGVADSPATGVADVDVWVTSDAAGATRLANGTTDSQGNVVFHLDAGTVYVWRQHPNHTFVDPDVEVVS